MLLFFSLTNLQAKALDMEQDNGNEWDTKEKIIKKVVMKITRQPMDADAILLKELNQIMASKPINNGGGQHGYIGLLYADADYVTFLNGSTKFFWPMHPITSLQNAPLDPNLQRCTEVKQMVQLKQCQKYLIIEVGLKGFIVLLLIQHGLWNWKMKKWGLSTTQHSRWSIIWKIAVINLIFLHWGTQKQTKCIEHLSSCLWKCNSQAW